MSKANLFLVGVPKSATTFLYNNLKKYDEIFAPDFKEPHYFSIKYRDFPETNINNVNLEKPEYCFNQKDYESLYYNSCERYRLDASVHYFYYKKTAKDIKKYCSNAKIIISLRNPINRAFSAFNYAKMNGLESLDKKFIDALNEEKQNRNFDPILYYENESYYFDSLNTFLEVFGDNVLILLFEQIKNNPRKVFEEISEFLGIKDTYLSNNNQKKHNKTYLPKNNLLNKFLLKKSNLKIKLKKYSPDFIVTFLKNYRDKILYDSNSDTEMSKYEYFEALSFFKDDILKTQKILNINLDNWLKYKSKN